MQDYHTLTLNDRERETLTEALQQRLRALQVEVAGTEKHQLQHELAQDIEQLEAVLRKVAGAN